MKSSYEHNVKNLCRQEFTDTAKLVTVALGKQNWLTIEAGLIPQFGHNEKRCARTPVFIWRGKRLLLRLRFSCILFQPEITNRKLIPHWPLGKDCVPGTFTMPVIITSSTVLSVRVRIPPYFQRVFSKHSFARPEEAYATKKTLTTTSTIRFIFPNSNTKNH